MEDSRIFITSDLHFGHQRDFLWRPRGFNDIEEHDKEVVKRWNEVVNENDIVYVLGDLVMNDNQHGIDCLRQLNGILRVVRGNHDSDVRWELYAGLPNVELLGWAHMLKYKKYHFYLSHFPSLCGNYDDGKSLKMKVTNLCGHTHTQNKFADWDKGIIYHCELDAHNCYPVLLEDIIKDLQVVLREDKENTQQS